MTFNNNSSQAERKQFVKDTFHSRTRDEAGGRFAQVNKSTVVGSDPATLYPRLPSGSPWSSDPVPPEPPLNQDISEPPIVGESWEVEKSLDRDFGVQRSLQDGAPPSSGGLIPDALEPAPGSEAIRAHDPADQETVDRVERHSPAGPIGRHSVSEGRVSPNNPSIKRRVF